MIKRSIQFSLAVSIVFIEDLPVFSRVTWRCPIDFNFISLLLLSRKLSISSYETVKIINLFLFFSEVLRTKSGLSDLFCGNIFAIATRHDPKLLCLDKTFLRYLQDIYIYMTWNRYFQDILTLSKNRLV